MDVVVTVPKDMWEEWLDEGDLPGDAATSEFNYHFWVYPPLPRINPGERVYIVAHGKLRGYAPLVDQEWRCSLRQGERIGCLIREGDAVAVTIAEPIRGFRGWRYRWWDREDEQPFPEWMTP